MSILRMASFKASYALFLKLVSGAIRTIAISASAMVGDALVGFRSGTTLSLLLWETSCSRLLVDRFLAYQIPECQDDLIFSILRQPLALTIGFLAYQMPYERVRRKTAARESYSAGVACGRIAMRQRGRRYETCEPKNDFKEEANVKFQRCCPQDS